MRISDWSSDVCSSDLPCGAGNAPPRVGRHLAAAAPGVRVHLGFSFSVPRSDRHPQPQSPPAYALCAHRSEEHTSELQSLMRISYAVFCLKKKTKKQKSDTRQLVDKKYTMENQR